MATTKEGIKTPVSRPSRRPQAGEDALSLKVIRDGGSFKPLLLGVGGLLTLATVWRIYQQAFAWKYGMDSRSAGFHSHWMTLLYVHTFGIPILSLIWYRWIAKGCKTCKAQRAALGGVTPRHEAGHIWRMWALIASYVCAVWLGGSFFAEQDAAWHQVAVRDTAFTPSHIVLFQGIFPIFVALAVGTYLYARDRLPHIYRDQGFPLSFGLLMAGSFLLLGNVAANEFFHSFVVAEENFSAPIHWGFVSLAYLLASTFAVWFSSAPRMFQLVDEEAAHQHDAVIAAPATS